MCGRFAFEHEWPAFLDLYELPVEERGRNTQARLFEGKVEQRKAGFRIIGGVRLRYHLSSEDQSFTAIGVFQGKVPVSFRHL